MVWVSRESQAQIDVFQRAGNATDDAEAQRKWSPIVSVGFVVSASVLLWAGLVVLVANILGAVG